METQKRTAKILYRTSKYGTWQPASITIPEGTENIKEYCIDNLKKLQLSVHYILIQKIIKT